MLARTTQAIRGGTSHVMAALSSSSANVPLTPNTVVNGGLANALQGNGQDTQDEPIKTKKVHPFADTRRLAAKIQMCSGKLTEILVWEKKITESKLVCPNRIK